MKKYNVFMIIVSSIGGIIGNALGGYDVLLKVLLCMIVVDILTGLLKAIYEKKLSFEKGYQGFIKKIMMILLLIAVVQFEPILGGNVPLREIFIMYFATNELISIIENATIMIPLPENIKTYFSSLRDKSTDMFNKK